MSAGRVRVQLPLVSFIDRLIQASGARAVLHHPAPEAGPILDLLVASNTTERGSERRFRGRGRISTIAREISSDIHNDADADDADVAETAGSFSIRRRDRCAAGSKDLWHCGWRGAVRKCAHPDPERSGSGSSRSIAVQIRVPSL